ncbi:putative LuxR-family transcriptional regulator [Actinoplanes missouriensis 431]|uniref:Putative LuxR-family transcriptional regulator n=1 Tax=Actinoplanes missouriensis (strain ATCC 14538 / DSM 43046 / CBS 188.64 / JCM 3121 / NBRC 102363 / NCIMB 12654 / NRRL B-3342 / UNCC 431) TaxID=512565 RepID=I0H474_ACTM4|nr:LuxR family transcriptional regulator [Actinoplanes missouriensis]BAL87811.1 putative LuxR-family transcriptional regulator [Actinoplanes missouriensis 431]
MPEKTTNTELRGRHHEREALDQLLNDVRSGHSRVLVLRGEAGSGKTALLDHLAGLATGCLVLRTAGVETDTETAYAAVQQICAPVLDHSSRLPEPQRDALAVAFSLSSGQPPEVLLLGLSVLGLLAEAAAAQPVVCVVDDAQWLDKMSETILAFVARRVSAEGIAMVFGVRSDGSADPLADLPDMVLGGLSDTAATELLASSLPGPIDPFVRARIIAETGGNPLALLELPRGLSPAELAFGFGRHSRTPVVGRVEQDFERRIAALPPATRRLLLAAAVEPAGNLALLWQAAKLLGVEPEAALDAEAAGLVTLGPGFRFRHSLVRSAVWRSAHPAELRETHRALAEVTDPADDPDRHAWHRAHATVGPDEEVATELEESATRALARGGRAAAASFLQRAAELTFDSPRRATLLLAAAQAWFDAGTPDRVPPLLVAASAPMLDPLLRARIERMQAHVAFLVEPGRASAARMLAAAQRLEPLDPDAARRAYLFAVGAALHAGRLGGDDARRAADAARQMPASEDFIGLLLTGLTTWVLDGYAEAQPALSRALAELNTDEHLDMLWLIAPAAHELFQVHTAYRITDQAVRYARATGSQSLLPVALSYRAGTLLFMGRFADATDLLDEGSVMAQATGIAFPRFAALALVAFRGDRKRVRELVEAMSSLASRRGEGRLLGLSDYAQAVLHNGLGEHAVALEAARAATGHRDVAIFGWALTELAEAAARAGDPEAAEEARIWLAERADAAGTEWARGASALAEALADPSEAAENRYVEALRRLSADGLDLLVARTRLLYGEWLRRRMRRSDAREQLRPAYDAFVAIGATAFAERAGRELAATGYRPAATRPFSGTRPELTAQEAHIARAAVAGRTNVEIAAAMFLSPRTVEWHLRKIYAKLDISSRRELARVWELSPTHSMNS